MLTVEEHGHLHEFETFNECKAWMEEKGIGAVRLVAIDGVRQVLVTLPERESDTNAVSRKVRK